MKNYTITVNGTAYDVTVEEGTGSAAAAPAAAPKAAPKAAPAAPKAAPAASGAAGSIKVEAGAAGKIFKIEKQVGASVKKGDAVICTGKIQNFVNTSNEHIYELKTPQLASLIENNCGV